MTLYKITAADGSSVHGGTGSWVPGEWREVEGELVQGSPTTEAGRALNANLAYDSYPEDYLPGDYISRYRDAILAIEAEAYEQGRKAGLTEALKMAGHISAPRDPERDRDRCAGLREDGRST